MNNIHIILSSSSNDEGGGAGRVKGLLEVFNNNKKSNWGREASLIGNKLLPQLWLGEKGIKMVKKKGKEDRASVRAKKSLLNRC